jgi:hypothetical protein
MLLDFASAVFVELLLKASKCAWENTRPLFLDRDLIDPPIVLNRRKGTNTGRGRGFRSQPDPNPDQFRKYEAVTPQFILSRQL